MEAIEEEPVELPLNKKNITDLITGSDCINLNELAEDSQEPESEPLEDSPETYSGSDQDNAIVDIIDIGLDFAEDFLKDAGYPSFKRTYWEQHGRKKLNKALNTYLPQTSDSGAVMDSSALALIIGLGALALCISPAVLHFFKQRKAAEEKSLEISEAQPAKPEPARPSAAPQTIKPAEPAKETDAETNQSEPDSNELVAILRKNHQQFKIK